MDKIMIGFVGFGEEVILEQLRNAMGHNDVEQ